MSTLYNYSEMTLEDLESLKDEILTRQSRWKN
jgi:hypothetical protein